jgi:uncharacterized membrane protein
MRFEYRQKQEMYRVLCATMYAVTIVLSIYQSVASGMKSMLLGVLKEGENRKVTSTKS